VQQCTAAIAVVKLWTCTQYKNFVLKTWSSITL